MCALGKHHAKSKPDTKGHTPALGSTSMKCPEADETESSSVVAALVRRWMGRGLGAMAKGTGFLLGVMKMS